MVGHCINIHIYTYIYLTNLLISGLYTYIYILFDITSTISYHFYPQQYHTHYIMNSPVVVQPTDDWNDSCGSIPPPGISTIFGFFLDFDFDFDFLE